MNELTAAVSNVYTLMATTNNVEAQLSISIGGDTVVYNVRQTRAPRDYDGFGTIQLATFAGENERYPERIVLIRDEHLGWQTARYSSGLFACTEPDFLNIDAIRTEIWQRIARESK